MRTIIKIDIFGVISNEMEKLKKQLTEARKKGSKRKIKAIKSELGRLNERLDWV